MAVAGWYAYAFAAEPFVVSAVATYVPLLLEGLARDNAVWVGDHRTPCRSTGDQPGLMPVPIAPPKCVIRLGSWWIDTSSLPLYTFSVSVALQTIVVVSISGLADRGAHRKLLLVGSAVIGALATIILGSIGRSHYYVASLLAIVANASFGAVSVCGNAFLPHIVSHQRGKLSRLRKTAVDRFQGAYPPLEQGGNAQPLVSMEETARISAHISGRGTAIGYAAALFVQVTTMIILVSHSTRESANRRLQLVIALIGWWWLLGQIPVVLYLPNNSYELETEAEIGDFADEPTLFENEDIIDTANDFHRGANGSANGSSNGSSHGDAHGDCVTESVGADEEADSESLLKQVSYGWLNLFRTVRKARKLRDITMFLAGWFLLSDAVMTINSTAVLFARTNLQMATPALALIGLITVVFAISGSLVFGAKKSQRHSLVLISLLAAVIPVYGILGFFQPWVGLKHAWETYLLAAWYGVALGALSAVTRSQFALLIPRGHEAMFFALYAVTDKGSSILGPTVTGMITDYTHNIRYTFYFLLSMMILAAFVFAQVDYERGQIEALEQSQENN